MTSFQASLDQEYKKATRTFLILSSVFLVAIPTTFIFAKYHFTKALVESSLVRNFEYWLKTGNSFEITRLAYNFSTATNAAMVVTKGNFTITSTIETKHAPPSGISVSNKGLVYSYQVPTQMRDAHITVIEYLSFTWILLVLLTATVTAGIIQSLLNVWQKTFFQHPKTFIKEILNIIQYDGLSKPATIRFSEAETIQKIRIELEKQIAERSNEATKIQLTREIAHDLRSPLTALSIIKSMSSSELSSENLSLLSSVIDRINGICSNLLGETRAEKEPDRSYSNLQEATEEIVKEKSIEISQRGIIKLNLKHSTNPALRYVNISKADLQRVLSNLINNAVEANPNQSVEIEVTTGSYGPNYITILVSDNGPGVPQNIRESVFEKDFSSNKPAGHGIGLYHAKRTLLNVGGEIWLDNTYSSGATFVLKLQTIPAPSESARHI